MPLNKETKPLAIRNIKFSIWIFAQSVQTIEYSDFFSAEG